MAHERGEEGCGGGGSGSGFTTQRQRRRQYSSRRARQQRLQRPWHRRLGVHAWLREPSRTGGIAGSLLSPLNSLSTAPPSLAGARFALRSDSYTLHILLPTKVDPLVSLMKVEKVPDSTYDMIGGLDQQIKEIKEVRSWVVVGAGP